MLIPQSLKDSIYQVIFFLRDAFNSFASILKFRGSSYDGQLDNGNILVRLNRATLLGEKGQLIQITPDSGLKKKMFMHAVHEPEVSEFLVKSINGSKSQVPIYVDVGANVGLIARQVLRNLEKPVIAHLVEPIQIYCEACSYNLSDLVSHKISISKFALGNEDDDSLFIDLRNRGNTTYYKKLAGNNFYEEKCEFKKTSDFFSSIENTYDIFLKIDTQGLDAQILSKIPLNIWARIRGLVVEVWAHDQIISDEVEFVCERLREMSISFDSNFENPLLINDLFDFWKSKSFEHRDLYCYR